MYQASNRPGGQGGLDIWVARRASVDAPWGAPQNLGEPVNSAADDFCPTPVRGRGLLFVSREALPGSCRMGDIYFTRLDPDGGLEGADASRLRTDRAQQSLDEQGPSFMEVGEKAFLYFSRSSASVPGDIFVSKRPTGGTFGAAVPVAALNDAGANDIQPNVRKDGREVVFSSNRSGTLGGQDIWVATRESFGDPWSVPVNLGAAINTSVGETRPSLSWDAQTLLFGRAPGPEGSGDIYVSTRTNLP